MDRVRSEAKKKALYLPPPSPSFSFSPFPSTGASSSRGSSSCRLSQYLLALAAAERDRKLLCALSLSLSLSRFYSMPSFPSSNVGRDVTLALFACKCFTGAAAHTRWRHGGAGTVRDGGEKQVLSGFDVLPLSLSAHERTPLPRKGWEHEQQQHSQSLSLLL